MQKGEIWMVDLNPTKGSEQAGVRPVLIVSGNLLNAYAPVIWVCPITSKVKKYKGNVVLAPSRRNGLSTKSEVMNLHLRSIAKERLIKKIGAISESEIHQVQKGIEEMLTLN